MSHFTSVVENLSRFSRASVNAATFNGKVQSDTSTRMMIMSSRLARRLGTDLRKGAHRSLKACERGTIEVCLGTDEQDKLA